MLMRNTSRRAHRVVRLVAFAALARAHTDPLQPDEFERSIGWVADRVTSIASELGTTTADLTGRAIMLKDTLAGAVFAPITSAKQESSTATLDAEVLGPLQRYLAKAREVAIDAWKVLPDASESHLFAKQEDEAFNALGGDLASHAAGAVLGLRDGRVRVQLREFCSKQSIRGLDDERKVRLLQSLVVMHFVAEIDDACHLMRFGDPFTSGEDHKDLLRQHGRLDVLVRHLADTHQLVCRQVASFVAQALARPRDAGGRPLTPQCTARRVHTDTPAVAATGSPALDVAVTADVGAGSDESGFFFAGVWPAVAISGLAFNDNNWVGLHAWNAVQWGGLVNSAEAVTWFQVDVQNKFPEHLLLGADAGLRACASCTGRLLRKSRGLAAATGLLFTGQGTGSIHDSHAGTRSRAAVKAALKQRRVYTFFSEGVAALRRGRMVSFSRHMQADNDCQLPGFDDASLRSSSFFLLDHDDVEAGANTADTPTHAIADLAPASRAPLTAWANVRPPDDALRNLRAGLRRLCEGAEMRCSRVLAARLAKLANAVERLEADFTEREVNVLFRAGQVGMAGWSGLQLDHDDELQELGLLNGKQAATEAPPWAGSAAVGYGLADLRRLAERERRSLLLLKLLALTGRKAGDLLSKEEAVTAGHRAYWPELDGWGLLLRQASLGAVRAPFHAEATARVRVARGAHEAAERRAADFTSPAASWTTVRGISTLLADGRSLLSRTDAKTLSQAEVARTAAELAKEEARLIAEPAATPLQLAAAQLMDAFWEQKRVNVGSKSAWEPMPSSLLLEGPLLTEERFNTLYRKAVALLGFRAYFDSKTSQRRLRRKRRRNEAGQPIEGAFVVTCAEPAPLVRLHAELRKGADQPRPVLRELARLVEKLVSRHPIVCRACPERTARASAYRTLVYNAQELHTIEPAGFPSDRKLLEDEEGVHEADLS